MFNVIRDFNLASVIRNAEVFGLDHVHVIGWRKYDKRGTVGAHKLIDITHHKDFDSFVEHVGIGNIVPIEHPDQYDLDNIPVPVSEYLFRKGHCLLLGEEGQGIPAEYLGRFARYCYIPQYGATRSLNAAVASGIVMHAARMCLDKQGDTTGLQ